MKRSALLIGILITAISTAVAQKNVLVEAESFDQTGGWVVDQQFIDIMGSSYLLAHGLGIPVKNASY